MAQYPLPEKRVVSLRPAQAKDIPGISALGTQVFASTFGYSMPAPDLEIYLNSAYSPSSIAADLANPDTTVIVACNDIDSVIGFVQLTEGTMDDCLKGTEKPVELQRLYVSQEYHGEGIGRKLVDWVEGLARERGFVTMWLGVVSITSL
jgi:predicted N-acetyltransferase YhbS